MKSPTASLAIMRELAAAKVNANRSNPDFIRDIEQALEMIAGGKHLAPVNENLLGLSFMLLMEVKRLRA
jgi:hypothetical protein